MSSVRLVRLKTGDKHDVQHGVVRLKADSSIFPERVGVTPNCSVGLRVSGTKTGKNPETGCFLLFFAFFAHQERTDTNCALFTPLYFCTAPSEKSGTGCFAGRLLCTSNFPLCQRGPVISPTSKIIFFCDASIHVCSSYMSSFLLCFNSDLAKVAVSILFFAPNYLNQFFTFVLG